MTRRTHLGVTLIAAGILIACGSTSGRGQSAPSDSPAPCTVSPCGAAPVARVEPNAKPNAKPNAAEKFPFPGSGGDAAKPPSEDNAKPSAGGVAQTPDAPVPDAAGKKTSAGDFPFPGDSSKTSPTGSPGGSSSSSSSGDDASAVDPDAKAESTPDAAGLKDKGSQGRHLLHRVNPIGTKLQTPDEREAEDLSVAHFYAQSGDLQGAYLRIQDAVKTVPDDPDAHFALAEIARKLNKSDQAIAEYNACLKLDIDDKKAAAARKALARLKP